MCTNEPLIIMAFGPLFGLWPSSFFMSSRDRGSRHFMLQNWLKTCKNEVPPKYMCKRENDVRMISDSDIKFMLPY